MKRIVLVALFAFFGLHLSSQSIDNPLTIKTEKSKIIRLELGISKKRMLIYKPKPNGKLPKKGDLRSEVVYNKNGQAITNSMHFPQMSLTSKYEYNEQGNTSKMTSLNGSGQIRQTLIYEYDNKNQLLRTKYYKPNGDLNSIKENKKDLIGQVNVSRNENGEITSKSTTVYDSVNNIYTTQLLTVNDELRYENRYILTSDLRILEWKVTDNVQNKKFIETYKYDDNGNEIESKRTDFEGTLIQWFTNRYNDKGLMFESIWYDSNNRIKQISKYEYEFFSN
jgi:hypothetical protein